MTLPRNRILYAALLALVIVAGLGSRRYGTHLPHFLAAYAGDTLWALGVALVVALVAPQKPTQPLALIAAALCLADELSQLYQAPWINAIRATTPGGLLLGRGFLWSDLACYAVGVTLGAAAEYFARRKTARRPRAAALTAAMLLCGAALLISPTALRAQTPAPDPRATHTLTGNVRKHEHFVSRMLPTRERTVWVWLPPNYDAPENRDRRYPVLYLADGQNVFDGATAFIPGQEWRADETAEELTRTGAISPAILVAVENAGAERANEYLPTGIASRDNPQRNIGGQADLYGQFLARELKPFIDRTYRTRTGPKDTALGGSSLAGILSLYLALTRPETFGAALVVSPSVWWADKDILREIAEVKRPDVRLYVDIGTDETGDKGEGSRKTLEDARALRDALIAKGWKPGRDFTYTEAEGARHNEAAWAARFPAMLRFLYGR